MRCRARAARRGSAALAAALLLPALGIYLAAPAVAASANAVLLAANPAGPWEQHLAVSPLATAPTRWVPGDSATGTLYLITQACTGATGTVAVTYTGAQSDIPLAQYLTFSATINGYSPTPIGSTFAIDGNTIYRLDLTATLPFGDALTTATNVTQDQTMQDLTVVVTLSCPDGSEIAYTGDPTAAPQAPAYPEGSDPWLDSVGEGKATLIPSSPSPSPTPSPTPTPSPGPSNPVTPTPTPSPSPTNPVTPTPAPSPNPSNPVTPSPSPNPSNPATPNPTNPVTPSPSPSSGGGGGWSDSGTAGPNQPAGDSMPPTGVATVRTATAAALLIIGGTIVVSRLRVRRQEVAGHA